MEPNDRLQASIPYNQNYPRVLSPEAMNTVKAAFNMRLVCTGSMGRWLRTASRSLICAVLLPAAIGYLPVSRAAQPPRRVIHDTVISRRDPAVEITLPGFVHYVGTDRFVLTDPALGRFDDCELYGFVHADSSRRVRDFYWVQFESYLPSHPKLHHTYDSPRHASLGGLDFYVDAWVTPSTKPPEAGSDEAHFYSLLASHGYRRGDFMYVRLVHLTDPTKRKELMIIHAESLARTGYAAAQLEEGGSEHGRWASIANALIRRAERSITVRASDARTP